MQVTIDQSTGETEIVIDESLFDDDSDVAATDTTTDADNQDNLGGPNVVSDGTRGKEGKGI